MWMIGGAMNAIAFVERDTHMSCCCDNDDDDGIGAFYPHKANICFVGAEQVQ